MGILHAFALLFSGLVAGILATMFDVVFVGACSFVSHVSLWVLLNALIAVHLESRLHAILWSIPFNLGYVEGYFITTVASFEGYAKSMVAPLAAMALLAPFLSYAIWSAKNIRNAYGRVLSLMVVAGTLGMCYAINKEISVYDGVVCALLAVLLLFVPTRKLKISRAAHPVMTGDEEFAAETVPDEGSWQATPRTAPETPRPSPRPRRRDLPEIDDTPSTRSPRRATPRPSKRENTGERSKVPTASSRRVEEQERREREARRNRSRGQSQRQVSRRGSGSSRREQERPAATLGNARAAVTRDSLRNM